MPETTVADSAFVDDVATALLAAEDRREEITPFSHEHPELDAALGYTIQDRTLQLRLERGEKLIGVKLGLTSKAKQQRMNVDSPIVGWVTDAHRLSAEDGVDPERFIHPRVEPEIFVTLKHDLEGPGATADDVRGAVDNVYAGLDVIDSRYPAFKFTHGDVVADNASGGGFIMGPKAVGVDDLDLQLEAVVVEVDGEVTDTATGAAILGHPLNSVAEGANLLAERGEKLHAGQLVMAGALTDAVALNSGKTIAFHFSNLGSIQLRGAGA